MNIQVGSIVKVCAGREKNRWFVAMAVHDGFVEICDGKERKLEKPKRKNIKHISPTNAYVDVNELTNKRLRRLISDFEIQCSHDADCHP